MPKRLPTICIPTYNRKNVLIDELMQYLSIKDDRYYIKIHDNCSNDGTIEALKEINDERLLLHFNEHNIGSVPNWMDSLCNCPSEYVLFVLDKDLVNIKELPSFLNYLETSKPSFGYINLDISKSGNDIITEPGYNNVKVMCYLDKHPSGYYYNTDVFNEAYNHPLFQKIDKMFIFPFEVLNGVISLKYPSTIIFKPLIINAAIREKKDTRTLSFNESNIWFGEPKRFLEFSYYLDNVLNLDLCKKDKSRLSLLVLKHAVGHVTFSLKNMLRNEEACYHYYVNCRKVTIGEMLANACKFIRYYYSYSNKVLSTVNIVKNIIYVSSITCLRVIKSYR